MMRLWQSCYCDCQLYCAQVWLSTESDGAKEALVALEDFLCPKALILIICDYYTISKEELIGRKLLSAADEAFERKLIIHTTIWTGPRLCPRCLPRVEVWKLIRDVIVSN